MDDAVTLEELAVLKARFRAADCSVSDLGEDSFEIVGEMFPVRTHVLVTAYYLQLSTYILASPEGFLPGRKSKLNAFLNAINLRAKLVKFTADGDKPDPRRRGWSILASVKLVTGSIGVDYDATALKNLSLLWFQDIAELIASTKGFELNAMMQRPNP